MTEGIFRYLFRFILIIAAQILLVSELEVSSYFHPFIYPYFILFLPASTPLTTLYILSFITGFAVDIFESTGGIHASALLFMAFFRAKVLNLFVSVEDLPEFTEPDLKLLGFNRLLVYSAIMIYIHHIFFFVIENGGVSSLLTLLIRIILSGIVTLVLILSTQVLFKPNKQK